MASLLVGAGFLVVCIIAAVTGNPMWIVPALIGVLFLAPVLMCGRRCPRCGHFLRDGDEDDCPHCGGTRKCFTED